MGKDIDSIALKWRNLLLDFLSLQPEDAPLILSGGMDSGTILAGLLANGRKSEIYNFQVNDIQSKDYHNAHKMVQDYN